MDDELQIKAYYAGHVLGAAMFLVTVGTQSFVYTVSTVLVCISSAISIPVMQGDYNMTPDRHLGSVSPFVLLIL